MSFLFVINTFLWWVQTESEDVSLCPGQSFPWPFYSRIKSFDVQAPPPSSITFIAVTPKPSNFPWTTDPVAPVVIRNMEVPSLAVRMSNSRHGCSLSLPVVVFCDDVKKTQDDGQCNENRCAKIGRHSDRWWSQSTQAWRKLFAFR